ncbi:MAG: MFS transporter, partial [Balneolaceae bacterium]|nr:MFS transporter [Balneolaceae bacterium]
LAWVLFVIALAIPQTALTDIDSPYLGSFILTIPLAVLFGARALDGITGGNVSVANAYLADVSTEKNRKANFGKMAASGNLGFIIGPALAGVLGSTLLGELLPVLVAMGISLAAIFVIAFMLQESRPELIREEVESCKVKKVLGQEHKECYKIEGESEIGLRKILKLEEIPFLLALYFIIFLAFNFFYVAFPVHAVERLQWSLFDLGIFFSVLGGIMVVVQGPVLSRMSDIFSDSVLIIAGSILLTAGFFLFSSDSLIPIYLGVLLFSGGNGIMWPSFLSILSDAAGERYQGAIQGYASSSGSLASIIGLLIGGAFYGWIGSATFWIPAILLLMIFGLSFRLLSLEKSASDSSGI